ncbi:MAG: 3-deoxy-manno-octulosonate cytidylyltransferase [Spirochaetia bacterium]|nr:3-deoxy-manno-octulosonate cytidylyltransferase [Spirochaetia bacterium]
MKKSFLAIIPARMKSTRFYGKPLAEINGKPMIQWVYEAAASCKKLDKILIATDSDEIYSNAKKFTNDILMTSDKHKSGLDRVIEAAEKENFTHYVNIQGDEPMISDKTIEGTINLFDKYDDCQISTAAIPFETEEEFENKNNVKVVLTENDRALYFSREAIPSLIRLENKQDAFTNKYLLKHQGLYAYTKDALFSIKNLKPCFIEDAEGLEQLRFLYYGYSIYVHHSEHESIGVDTPEDLKKVSEYLRS